MEEAAVGDTQEDAEKKGGGLDFETRVMLDGLVEENDALRAKIQYLENKIAHLENDISHYEEGGSDRDSDN